MRPKIFITGSANIDLTFQVGTMPRFGVTQVCDNYQMGFGGKGANQAVSAARLGADVTFLGKVGSDAFGAAIQEQLRKEGIQIQHLTVAPNLATGTAVILVDSSGQNCIITHGGPNVTLSVEDVLRARSDIEAAQIVLATLETPGPALKELFQIAQRAGVITILNPAPPVTFPEELLHWVDLCIPNESELGALTGMAVESLEEVAAALDVLEAKGPRSIAVTLGERGVLVKHLGRTQHFRAEAVNAVDTSGAGDSFCGSLAVHWATHKQLLPAIDYAKRVAAISVTRPGTQSSFPTLRELD